MRNSIKTLVKNLFTLIQVLIIFPPMLLQYLSERKMGVMRYLVFKKDLFAKEIFTSSFTYTYKNILFLGIILCTIFLIYSYTKKINYILIKPICGVLILQLLCILLISYYKFQILLTFHFFLISFFIIIILQYLKIILKWFKYT